jgi:hypothetical protein
MSGWSATRLGPFNLGNDPVPVVQETGWAPGPVWTGTENLATPIPRFDPRAWSSVVFAGINN